MSTSQNAGTAALAMASVYGGGRARGASFTA